MGYKFWNRLNYFDHEIKFKKPNQGISYNLMYGFDDFRTQFFREIVTYTWILDVFQYIYVLLFIVSCCQVLLLFNFKKKSFKLYVEK